MIKLDQIINPKLYHFLLTRNIDFYVNEIDDLIYSMYVRIKNNQSITNNLKSWNRDKINKVYFAF